MSIIVGFVIAVMLLLLFYMAYRLMLKRQLIVLASICLQIFALTIALFSFLNNIDILSSNLVELAYIVFGIIVPLGFLFYDYRIMIKKVREKGVYEGFIVVSEDSKASGDSEIDTAASFMQLNANLREQQVTEIMGNMKFNNGEILRNLKNILTQAQLAMIGKEYDNAFEMYNNVVKLIKSSPEMFFNLGNINYHMGKYSDAVRSYRKSLELLETRPVLKKNVREHEMTDETDKDIKTFPNLKQSIFFNLGNAYYKQFKYDCAVEEYKKAYELDKRLISAVKNTARSIAMAGRTDEAAAYYKKVFEDRLDDSIYLFTGSLFFKANMLEDAEKDLRECVRLNPSCKDALYIIGKIMLETLKMSEAEEVFEKIVKMDIGDYDAHYNLGLIYFRSDKKEKALECFQRVIDLNPSSYVGYFNLGTTLSETGRYDEAAAAYKKALELKPDEYIIYYHLASMFIEMKKYREAVEAYKCALKFKPDDSELYYGIAATYSLLGKYSPAFDNLKKAFELNSRLKDDARSNSAFKALKTKTEFKQLVS